MSDAQDSGGAGPSGQPRTDPPTDPARDPRPAPSPTAGGASRSDVEPGDRVRGDVEPGDRVRGDGERGDGEHGDGEHGDEDSAWMAGQGRAGELADAYARHLGQLRGALRQALVSRALLLHLPPGPQRVLDVGGGAGHQAIALARVGHHVTLLDPDPTMLGQAQASLERQPEEVRKRVVLQRGPGEDALLLVGGDYDAVCCHGVLMYIEEPTAFLATMTAAARPGGLVSVLTKNAAAQAMRPGLEGRYADALDMLRRWPPPSEEPAQLGGNPLPEVGRLGVTSRAHTQPRVSSALQQAGASTVAWYGVRVFTDHLRDAVVGSDFDLAVEAEWTAGARDPYRQLARLIHIIARRHPHPPAEPDKDQP